MPASWHRLLPSCRRMIPARPASAGLVATRGTTTAAGPEASAAKVADGGHGGCDAGNHRVGGRTPHGARGTAPPRPEQRRSSGAVQKDPARVTTTLTTKVPTP